MTIFLTSPRLTSRSYPGRSFQDSEARVVDVRRSPGMFSSRIHRPGVFSSRATRFGRRMNCFFSRSALWARSTPDVLRSPGCLFPGVRGSVTPETFSSGPRSAGTRIVSFCFFSRNNSAQSRMLFPGRSPGRFFRGRVASRNTLFCLSLTTL